jgi:signal transduction histidine kinase/CHASE3 domain sensor protein
MTPTTRPQPAPPLHQRPARSVLSHVLGRLLPAWAALALVLLALLLLISQLRGYAQGLEQAAQQVTASEVLRSDVLDMETGLRGYALTGDAQFLEPYNRASSTLYGHLRAFRAIVAATQQATVINQGAVINQGTVLDQSAVGQAEQIEELIGRWRQQYVKPLLALNSPGQYALQDQELSRTGKNLVDQIRVLLNTAERLGQRRAAQTQLQIGSLSRVWVPLLAVLTVLALLLNLGVLLRLSNEIRQGVRAVIAPDEPELGEEQSGPYWQETVEARASMNTRVSAVQGQLEEEREQLRLTGLTLDGVLNAMTAQLWVLGKAEPDHSGTHTSGPNNSGPNNSGNSAPGQAYLVRRVNQAGMTALKLPPNLASGQPLAELWPELAELLSSGQGVLPQEPYQLSTPSGPRWYLLTREAQEVGQLLVLTDVTQLQGSRRALEELNLNLTRSNTDLEHYAFVASHDLQEPLRTIASFAGLLLMTQNDRLDERGQLYARNVIEGATRLKQLIQDLLSFAKVRAEQLEFVPVDMNRVTQAVLLTLQDEVQRSGASVTVGPLPTVIGRESLLTQLVFNLLQNALKFAQGDELAQPANPAQILVTGALESELARFTVEDNGIGIAPEYQDQVFVIFQRLHGRGRYAGNGLGLAICRRITELHGGHIWLESAEGAGSRFHFTLLPAQPGGILEISAGLDSSAVPKASAVPESGVEFSRVQN